MVLYTPKAWSNEVILDNDMNRMEAGLQGRAANIVVTVSGSKGDSNNLKTAIESYTGTDDAVVYIQGTENATIIDVTAGIFVPGNVSIVCDAGVFLRAAPGITGPIFSFGASGSESTTRQFLRGAKFIANTSQGAQPMISVGYGATNQAYNLTIEQCMFDPSGQNWASMIAIRYGSKNIRIRDCYMTGAQQRFVDIGGLDTVVPVQNVYIENNVFDTCALHGIYIDDECANVNVVRNKFVNVATTVAYRTILIDASVNPMRDIRVQQNSFEGGRIAIQASRTGGVSLSDIWITDNQILSCIDAGIHVEGDNINIRGNVIDTTVNGIQIKGDRITIKDNFMTGLTGIGVYIYDVLVPTDLVVEDNYIDCFDNGVEALSGAGKLEVTGNTILSSGNHGILLDGCAFLTYIIDNSITPSGLAGKRGILVLNDSIANGSHINGNRIFCNNNGAGGIDLALSAAEDLDITGNMIDRPGGVGIQVLQGGGAGRSHTYVRNHIRGGTLAINAAIYIDTISGIVSHNIYRRFVGTNIGLNEIAPGNYNSVTLNVVHHQSATGARIAIVGAQSVNLANITSIVIP